MVRPGRESLAGAEDAGLLELELGVLLVAVHLDDERDDEDEEGGAEVPGGLAGALQKLVGHERRVGGVLLAAGHRLRLRDLRQDAVVLLRVPPLREGHSAFASLAGHL